MKSILKILFITIIIFVLTDFFFGKKIDKILIENNFYITFDSAIEKNIKHEKKFRVKNEIFSHSLKENYKGISFFWK